MPKQIFIEKKDSPQREFDSGYPRQQSNYQSNPRQNYNQPERRNWKQELEDKKQWISKEIDSETITYCEDFARELAGDGFTAAQLRKIFSEIRRIQLGGEFSKKDFILLKPKIAYTAAKSKNSYASQKFSDVVLKAHSFVDLSNPAITKICFDNFCHFMEAIVAYHKVYYKGKD